MKNRIISILMALMLALGSCPVPEQTGYVYGEYLEILESADDSELDGLDEFFMLMLFSMLMQGDDSDADTSLALTPDGNLSLIDDIDTATEEDAGKQFITVETKPDPDADYEDEDDEEDYEIPDLYEEDADADDSDGEDSGFEDDEPV